MGLDKADFTQAMKLYRMNLRNRFLGSKIGLAWAILNPLLLMLVYVFVFGFVMKQADENTTPLQYLVLLISGLSPWLAISDGINAMSVSVVNSTSILKAFPIKSELMPLSTAMMGLPQLLVGIVLLVILNLATGAGLSLHVLWLLLVVPVLFACLAGMGFFLSAITVFIRDITQVINTALMFLMFMTPIFYTVESLPLLVQRITFFNPVYQMIDPFRQVFVHQRIINLAGFLYLCLLTVFLWVFGLRFFRKRQGLFESVL